MPELEPIDLHHVRDGVVACYLVETAEGPALFDCGPATTVDALKAGLAARGLAAHRRPPPAAQPHPPRPRGRGGHARARAARDSRCTCRRSARRTCRPAAAREQRAPAVRRLRSTRSGASSRRCRRENMHVVGARVLGLDCFPSPATHRITSATSTVTARCGRATPQACGIVGGTQRAPPTPPPDIDVEVWESTLDEIERREPEPAGADPLRRRRRPRAPSRRSCGSRLLRLGGGRSRAARRGGVHRVRPAARLADAGDDVAAYDPRCRCGSRTTA